MAVEFRTLPIRAAVKPVIVRPPVARAGGALGEVLLERELITREQLTLAIEHQRSSPERRLGQVLLDLGFTTPDAVLGALSVQLGVPATRLNGFTVSHAAVQALPEKIARKHLAVPLQKIGTMLQVAIASPTLRADVRSRRSSRSRMKSFPRWIAFIPRARSKRFRKRTTSRS